MKTHLTILLLLLLVFAGSCEVLVQTDKLKPGLPDEEVIRLRAELVDALENDSIEKAKEINDSLRSAPPKDMLYLSFREQYLTLFLLGSYNSILETYPSVYTYNNDTTRFQRIDLELMDLALAQKNEILDDIKENYNNFDLLSLNGLFSILTDHKPLDYYSLFADKDKYGRLKDKRVKISDSTKQLFFQNPITVSTSQTTHPYIKSTIDTTKIKLSKSQKSSDSLKRWDDEYYIDEYGRLKDKRVKNNPDNFLDDQTVFRIGFGVFYQTGWYYGEISKYFSHYNSASIINAHISVYKFYLAGTLLNAGGANTKQNIVVNNNLSSATHLSSSFIFDITTGYSCFQKKHFELTPVVFYQWQVNSIERARNRLDPEKLGDINHYGPGFGFIADFIFSNRSWSKNSLNQWAIRLKYGINFSTDNTKTKAVSGILNQFSIGLIYSKLYY